MSQRRALLTPRKGSKKFYSEAKEYKKVLTRNSAGELSDTGQYQNTGNYTGERFPQSRQFFRIKWSESKQMYPIGDMSLEELNKLVPQCGFTDPKTDKLIETANNRRFGDPFFEHVDLFFLAEEGTGSFDLQDPKQTILYAGFTNNVDMKSSNNNNPLLDTRVKYVLTDPDEVEVDKSNKIDKLVEAMKLFDGLSFKKMFKIARSMGIGVNEEVTPETLKSTLGEVIQNNTRTISPGKTFQDYFIELAKAKNEDLELNFLVRSAIKKGIIRKKRGQGYLFYGSTIAKKEELVVPYFKDPANQEQVIKLEEALEVHENGKEESKNSK